MAFLEGALQFVQLIGRERGPVPAVFLFTTIALRQTGIIGRALVFGTASSDLSVSQIRHAVVRVTAPLACEINIYCYSISFPVLGGGFRLTIACNFVNNSRYLRQKFVYLGLFTQRVNI